MKPSIFLVDFNNADDDKSVRLTQERAQVTLDGQVTELLQSMEIIVTDTELWARGKVTRSDGFWIILIEEWLDFQP